MGNVFKAAGIAAVVVIVLQVFAVESCRSTGRPPRLTGVIEVGGPWNVKNQDGGLHVPYTGDVLYADTRGISGDGELSFLWRSGSENVPGYTGRTYRVRSEDAGRSISVIVFCSGYTGGIVSLPTFPALNGKNAPAISVPQGQSGKNEVSITVVPDPGDPVEVGATLAAVPNKNVIDLVNNPALSSLGSAGFVYQWKTANPGSTDYVPIAGANAERLVLRRESAGKNIIVCLGHVDFSGVICSGEKGPVGIAGRVEPVTRVVPQGGRQQFTAVLSDGVSGNITWKILKAELGQPPVSLDTGAIGTIDKNGMLNVDGGAHIGAIITIAAELDGTELSGKAGVMVSEGPMNVDVKPDGPVSMAQGEARKFSASVDPPTAAQNVWWTVEPAPSGSVSQGGFFQVDRNAPPGSTVRVRATERASGIFSDYTDVIVRSSSGGNFSLDISALLQDPNLGPVQGPYISVIETAGPAGLAPGERELSVTYPPGEFSRVQWFYKGIPVGGPSDFIIFGPGLHGWGIAKHRVTVEATTPPIPGYPNGRTYSVIVVVEIGL